MKDFKQLFYLMKSLIKDNISIYDFEVETIDGRKIKLEEYKDKVLLIVNVASFCKFTPQYKELELLYQEYKERGLVILGFPCNQFENQEPNSNHDIKEFCSSTYNITFPLFSKIEVNGNDRAPLYSFLDQSTNNFFSGSSINWNFTKFLIDKKGEVFNRYSSVIQPLSIQSDIEKSLSK